MDVKGLQDCSKTLKMGVYNLTRLPIILCADHGAVVVIIGSH